MTMRGMTTRRAGTLAALVAAVGSAVPLLAQGPGYPELSRDDELRLALSAGPPSISREAELWVMGARGFEKAVAGSNGWACLVVRNATNRIQLAPHCLNPDAVASVLPAFRMEAELQAQGLGGEEVSARMDQAWKEGSLPIPSGPAHAYMLSKGQRVGPQGGNFRPHFMLYVPWATNASIGGDLRRPEFPFVGPYENHPLSTVVILMDEFVDPADMVVPRR